MKDIVELGVDWVELDGPSSIPPGGLITVHVGSETDTATDLYMGFNKSIYGQFDGAFLLDPDHREIIRSSTGGSVAPNTRARSLASSSGRAPGRRSGRSSATRGCPRRASRRRL